MKHLENHWNNVVLKFNLKMILMKIVLIMLMILVIKKLLFSLVVLLILILFTKSEFYTKVLVSNTFNIGKKSYPCLDFAPFVMIVSYILLGLGIVGNVTSLVGEAIKPSDED